jgi:hypothetical protein
VILEANTTINLGEDRIILSNADIQPRPESASPLPNKNGATSHDIPIESLHTKTLCVAVTTVPRASLSFFMCHD